MNRLFVLGCSFSNYAWPSWADMLGQDYEHYENWAYPGLGNRAICERLAEIIARYNISDKDTIIIQWTSHLRHDWHTNDQRHDVKPGVGWKTSGSIFNYINSELYDDNWIKTFWDENSYIMHTLNYILLAQGLLKSTGCNWRMTSMGYIHKMNGDYPDSDHGEKSKLLDLWKQMPALKIYEKIFEDKTKWITPVGTYAWQHNTLKPFSFKSGKGIGTVEDRHPTPEQHADYVQTQVYPSLMKSQNLNDQTKKWIDTVNNIYEQTHRDFNYFCEKVGNDLDGWHNSYRGF